MPYALLVVGSRPKRFLMMMRLRENLSSGEKRAGKLQRTRMRRLCHLSICRHLFERIQTLAVLVSRMIRTAPIVYMRCIVVEEAKNI